MYRESWRELMRYRELLVAFTLRNIKIKYKQTFMGFLWALFMPMIIVLSGVIVKMGMAMYSGKEVELAQIASVMVKALPWAFFIGALKFSVGSLVGNMGILKKIYFPRVIFPLSYTIGQLFDFVLASIAFTIVFIFARLGVSVHLLWLPVLIILLFTFTAGLGLIFSCGNLYYRDVKYIIDVILTFAIFFTPVFYEASMFPKFEMYLMLNPVGSLLECINSVVVMHQAPPTIWFIYACVCSLGTFWIGWTVFHKAEPTFADNI